jgi:hypothetical protein
MKRSISLWGLVFVLLCSLSGTARADETPPAGSVGLGLAIGGGALTLVSGSVLLAMTACRPDPSGEGCPPRGEQRAALVGTIAGLLMLGVGLPLYMMSSAEEKRIGNSQAASAFNAMNVRLSF